MNAKILGLLHQSVSFVIVYVLFSLCGVQDVHSQHANERDIQLPEPVHSELSTFYLIGDSTV